MHLLSCVLFNDTLPSSLCSGDKNAGLHTDTEFLIFEKKESIFTFSLLLPLPIPINFCLIDVEYVGPNITHDPWSVGIKICCTRRFIQTCD